MCQYHFLHFSAQNDKIKRKANAIFVIQSTAELFAHIFRKTLEGGVITDQIVKDLAE